MTEFDPQRTWARSTSRSAPAVSRRVEARASLREPDAPSCWTRRTAVGPIRALEPKKGTAGNFSQRAGGGCFFMKCQEPDLAAARWVVGAEQGTRRG